MVGIDLCGRVALVTGASRGLGRAAALARAGADVVVNYLHNQKAAPAVARSCEEFGVRASELSTFVTGEILNVNGGAVLVG